MKRLINIGLQKPHQKKFHVDGEEWEFLARMAFERKNLQAYIEECLFPPDWKKKLYQLRRKHRVIGESDEKFMPEPTPKAKESNSDDRRAPRGIHLPGMRGRHG